jgi:phage shock protein PspC (stress-responsive transcriptional regulator)
MPASFPYQVAEGDREMSETAIRRLTRRPDEGKLGGVCAGMALYFDVDVALVRIAWIALSIWPGAILLGVVAYVAAWALMPRAEAPAPPSTRPRLVRSTMHRKVAGVCGGLADYFGVDPTIVRVAWVIASIVPGLVVFGVIAYLVAWFAMPRGPFVVLHPSPSTT